jgi:glycosyltransferase involved in cell wall biosynthesis
MRSRLSALVPCGDEESVIRGCLESVRWADEVLVVLDAASRDGSRAICEELADRILVHPYEDSASQKNWAIPQCAHPWVLVVDADERVTSPLRERILAILADNGGGYDGFRIRRENLFYGRVVRHGGWHSDYQMRLFRRDAARYEPRRVHAGIRLSGRAGRLEEPLRHDTHRGMAPYLRKLDRYTTWAAEDLRGKGRGATWASLLFRPTWRFLRMYGLRLGFLDGVRGLLIAGSAAMVVFTKYAKLWEMQQREAPAAARDRTPAPSPEAAAVASRASDPRREQAAGRG